MQLTLDDILTPPKANPCEGCVYYINQKCTYPETRWDYCFGKGKYKPKTNEKESSNND